MFITFEGIDGCGKTTQIKLLSDYLVKKGLDVFVTREPGGSEMGEYIEKIFKSKEFSISPMCELLLMLSDRLYHIENIILPYMEKGYIVISDRYHDSTIAYQGYGGSISIDKIEEITTNCGINLKPDITFLIDIPLELASSRIDLGDRIESKGLEFFKKVIMGYYEIERKEPDRVVKIDGTREKKVVHMDIVNILERRFFK